MPPKPEIVDADSDRYHRVDYSPAQLLNKFFTIKSRGSQKFGDNFDRMMGPRKRSDRCNKCQSPNYVRCYAIATGYRDHNGIVRSKSNDLQEYSTKCRDCGFECKTDDWGK